jgi:copper chaperone CopZ
MTHTYNITGTHCQNCAEKIEKSIRAIPDIENISVTLDPPKATITMKKHVSEEVLNAALGGVYTLTMDTDHNHQMKVAEVGNDAQYPLKAYYPLFLVFGYIIGLVGIKQYVQGYSLSQGMTDFMGIFFITFSFFKLLDLRGFAAAYSSYDIITKRWLPFGYIYPFIEVVFGIGFLFFPQVKVLYVASFLIMVLSIIGVIESVTNKRKITCACLGTVFNLPMGTITIIEDGLMIVMSLGMAVKLFF